MKYLFQIIKISVLVLIMFSLSGCLEIFFKTEIHPNGNIDKAIILEGDSTSIQESYIPAVSDDSWDAEWEVIEEDKHRLTLRKSFSNIDDFNMSMNPDDSLPKIRIMADLRKKFRWFFSYIEYQETLLPNNPFTRLDWEEFLTADEIDLIAMDEEERKADPRFAVKFWSETESQFERYLFRSGYEEFYQDFMAAVKKTGDPRLTAEDLAIKKEVIYDSLFSKGNIEGTDNFLEHFYAVLDSSGVDAVITGNPEFVDFFDMKIDFFNECLDDNYYFSIKMPGLLTDTNSEQIEGPTLSWEIDFFDFYFRGLEMKAESRVINTWAFVLAGAIVLGLLLGLLWDAFRRKRP